MKLIVRRAAVAATLALLLVVMGFADFARAEDTDDQYIFGKDEGSIYLGGTAGLTGVDSLRGYVDSVFYSRWWENIDQVRQSLSTGGQKVIYGADDRRDIYTISDPNILKLAQATCVLAFMSEISDNGNGTYTLGPGVWNSQGGLPLCSTERFAGQPQMGNCSGFLVGEDLVVTAGHCQTTCGTYAYVFGWEMVDSLTPPPTIISEDDVYFCTEILSAVGGGDTDHCLLRLDRPVVGRTPIEIRRSGIVPNDDSVIVVGHPTVLPMKASGGAVVRDNHPANGWFESNLDTYGGNSGSMVVNTSTWVIEGILVRGNADFTFSSCAASNVLPDINSDYEEVTKTTVFSALVPELITSAGEVFLDGATYNCSDTIGLSMRDLDLQGAMNQNVLVFTSAGDSETVNLTETGTNSGMFDGSIETETGSIVKEDGSLQVSDGDIVTLEYADADDGNGSPALPQETANIDCTAPVISNVMITDVAGVSVTVTFDTDEPANGMGMVGTTCGVVQSSGAGGVTTSHSIVVGGLSPLTNYSLWVSAADPAGNSDSDDNGGACYNFTTADQADYFTELMLDGESDVAGGQLKITPDGSADFYSACRVSASDFPTDRSGGTALSLTDDDFEQISFTDGKTFPLYGTSYSSVYIGSNGFVTFGSGDTDVTESIDEHFASPPRISAYWDDFDPPDGGQVTYEQLSDRFVVTWDSVTEYSSSSVVNYNDFQLEMHFDGTIVITHLEMQSTDGLVGISEGLGTPADFVTSDITGYPSCGPVLCYVDADGDGFGDENDAGTLDPAGFCGPGFSANNLDCNDGDNSIYPGADEIPNDGIDQDCNGVDAVMCYVDADSDNYGDENDAGTVELSGVCPSGSAADNTDCNDIDSGINPGATEIPDDGIDQNCDGEDPGCCEGIRGDANDDGNYDPSVTDIGAIIDMLFITGNEVACMVEADVNASGGTTPTRDDISVSDIALIVDYLFITGDILPSCP